MTVSLPGVRLQVLAGPVRAQRGRAWRRTGRRSTTRWCPWTARPGCRARAAARWAGSPGRRSARSRWTPTPSRRWPRSGGRSPRSAWRRARRSCCGVMNPCSCISRMPSSLVAPHTPACVVTGTPRSRATSNAAFSGNSGSPVTSKAIWKPSMSSPPPNRRLDEVAELRRAPTTPTGPAGCCRRPARTGRAPRCSASTAASAWSTVCRPCDQSTVVVTPASIASMRGQQVAGVDVLRAGTTLPHCR